VEFLVHTAQERVDREGEEAVAQITQTDVRSVMERLGIAGNSVLVWGWRRVKVVLVLVMLGVLRLQ
jgi:hypothetical protein